MRSPPTVIEPDREARIAALIETLHETGQGPEALTAGQVDPVADPLILVAEDNEINQKVLSKQLSLLGYRAEMVGDGVQALARWRRGGHALRLTDLHMPVMDGYTLAAAVRAEEGEGEGLDARPTGLQNRRHVHTASRHT